jgi:hypothetical protein
MEALRILEEGVSRIRRLALQDAEAAVEQVHSGKRAEHRYGEAIVS